MHRWKFVWLFFKLKLSLTEWNRQHVMGLKRIATWEPLNDEEDKDYSDCDVGLVWDWVALPNFVHTVHICPILCIIFCTLWILGCFSLRTSGQDLANILSKTFQNVWQSIIGKKKPSGMHGSLCLAILKVISDTFYFSLCMHVLIFGDFFHFCSASGRS